MVYIYNYGTSEAHLKALFQKLPPGFMYVGGSYVGPKAHLTKDYVGDHWELRFDFRKPLPKLGAQEAMFISFIASTRENMGEYTYPGGGWVSYAGFQIVFPLDYRGKLSVEIVLAMDT